MLSPLERRALAEIEAQLQATDPGFTRRFSDPAVNEASDEAIPPPPVEPLSVRWSAVAASLFILVLVLAAVVGFVERSPAGRDPHGAGMTQPQSIAGPWQGNVADPGVPRARVALGSTS